MLVLRMVAWMRVPVCFTISCLGLLRQILNEVKSSNQILSEKVSELEKKVCELQEDTPILKKKKVSPSREVRVRYLIFVNVHSSYL